MAGTTKLMTPGGGGVNLTPASSIASDVTVNLPTAVNGATLAVNGPAFSAYQTGDISLAQSTAVKCVLNTEVFDTNSNFDPTTNYRFTPTVSGYYIVSGGVGIGPCTAGAAFVSYIFKNGTTYAVGVQAGATSGSNFSTVVSVIYMNGTTDYLELYAAQTGSGTINIYGGQTVTYMSGALVRAA